MTCFRTAMQNRLIVIQSDLEVNQLEVALDDMCSHLIVRRQPAANDLRTMWPPSR
jgi:phosphate transport system protein